ncbi:MAG: FecR family protein [Chitinophagaceae bacterium]
MQEINDELINKFFSGLCTKEEAVKVLDYLKNNPDHHYLVDEWNNTDGKTLIPAHYTLEMYDAVVEYIGKEEKRSGKLRLLWRIAAAACVVSIFISLWFGTVRDEKHPELAKTNVERVEWTERLNTQDTAIVIVLPDASRITLSPKTYIRYRKNFEQYARRDVYMQGQAFFEVSKNKKKPFTVYSGFISTTALGTAFRVTTYENESAIKVRLNEGKVVVAVTDTAYEKIHKDYYLLAGEELVFNTKNKTGIVHAFLKRNSVKSQKENEYSHQPSTDESYMFNNQTLADVLDQLATIYQVKIDYSKKEIGEIYFIGRIERNDPVEKTIQDIALLNKLSVKKQNGGFILKRKKY